MSSRAARFFWPVVSIAGIIAVVLLLALNATAREVVKDAAVVIFSIVTTPFIFEATVALGAVFLLLFVNQWRLRKEGDGWVYLLTQEPEEGTSKLPASITQRLQGLMMQDKPEAVDEAGTTRAKIEGFLELGMAAQAAEALNESSQLADDEATGALRIRVLAANFDTERAQQLLRASTARFAQRRILFAQTALDCATWVEAHAPHQRETAQLWRDEMKVITGENLKV